jgi:hypothetical protein
MPIGFPVRFGNFGSPPMTILDFRSYHLAAYPETGHRPARMSAILTARRSNETANEN